MAGGGRGPSPARVARAPQRVGGLPTQLVLGRGRRRLALPLRRMRTSLAVLRSGFIFLGVAIVFFFFFWIAVRHFGFFHHIHSPHA